jgi:hypothetical protein
MIAPDALARLIGAGRYDLSWEIACQADIATLLAAEGLAFVREHRLSGRDRLDFLVEGGIAVEVKMNRTAPAAILRQLERYAEHDAVQALILATNRAVGWERCEIGGKPAFAVSLGWGWL